MAGTVRPSVRLDEAQMAALKAAAERNGTTVSALLRQGAAQVTEPAPPAVSQLRPDAFTGALRALVNALRGLGIADPMPEVSRALARMEEFRVAASAEAKRATDGRAALVDMLLSGEVDMVEAARCDAEFAPWLDGSRPALALRDRVVDRLRAEMKRAVSGDALPVHDDLVKRFDAAVGRAVEAGRRLVDVPRMVELLASLLNVRSGRDPRGFPVDPFPAGRPKLPGLALEDVQSDAGRMAAWGDASAAMDELTRLDEVAKLLGELSGWSFSWWGRETNKDALRIVEQDLPRPAWLAVIDGAGWRPSLVMQVGRSVGPPRWLQQ